MIEELSEMTARPPPPKLNLNATIDALQSSNAPAAAEAAQFVARIISDVAQDEQYPSLLTDPKTIGALLKLAQDAPGKPLYLRAAATCALREYCRCLPMELAFQFLLSGSALGHVGFEVYINPY